MHDVRPERERYRRASILEQLGGELRALRASPPLLALLAVLLGGWAILTFTRPTYLGVGELTPGECVYIRASDADTEGGGRAIGSSGAAVTALFGDGAERAGCDASHSHEVADAWVLADGMTDPFPGPGVLAEREAPRCDAAFASYVGRAADGSELEAILAVPDDTTWAKGARAAVCLVARRDGAFLSSPARGSGR